MREKRGMSSLRNAGLMVACLWMLLAGAMPSAAQKDKDKKKKETAAAEAAETKSRLPEEQQIDLLISEMLGAWQLGDAERMHRAYADEVSVVSGLWEPPVVGWANYLAVYQKQRARLQQVSLQRQNTYVRVDGNTAWACYQWEFAGMVDGERSAERGQTTLLLEKRGGRWLIVHNHTSLVQRANAQPAQTPATAPSKP